MSKKSRNAELIATKVAKEREWMHARWMERMSFHQIAAAAALPIDEGGLGILVSPAGCKAMVHAYREDRGDLTMSREERRERQSDEVDERARRARYDLARAHADANAPMPAREEFDDDDDWKAELAVWKLRMEAGLKAVDLADRRLAAAQKDERDLHGLTAAAELKVDVVHRDAIIAELETELAALDEEVGA